jgi:hypothetical protein
MNKLLLSVLILALTGCGYHGKLLMHMHGMTIHEAKVSLKNGVPCFLPLDNFYLVGKPVRITMIYVDDRADGEGEIWKMPLNIEDALSKKCIPYEGSTELKKNIAYRTSLFAHVEGQEKDEVHGFAATFCMTENKGGKTILHQVDPFVVEAGATCPTSSAQ